MESYNVMCPCCGKINHHLYLEETNGYMECEGCHAEVRVTVDMLVSDYFERYIFPVMKKQKMRSLMGISA